MKLKKCNGRKERWKRDMKMKLKELLPDMRNRLKKTRSDMKMKCMVLRSDMTV